MIKRKKSTLSAIPLAWFALTAVALACPIPVFQYSLEHWETDPYEITVYHDGNLTEDQNVALEMLSQAQRGEGRIANIEVTIRQLGEETADTAGPQFEVRYPKVARIDGTVWSGELSSRNVQSLLTSPARQRLGEGLLRRVSAVWLFLESGDRARDRELENLLKQQSSRFEREIVIPDSSEWGGHDVPLHTEVAFDVIRISRNDPAEQMLIRMLLASEPDLESDFDGEPMVFPIFGRGIILYALVGRGINGWTLEEAANFITGACSNQSKAANPGTDLLMDVDWQARVETLTPATVGETVGTGTFLRGMDEAEQDYR